MTSKQYLIQNVQVVNADEMFVADVLVGEGRILEVLRTENALQSSPFPKGEAQEIDGTGKLLMPGLIDPHVHFREPGFEHKEDFATGSRAAVANGVTSFFDMPNTNPPTFTVPLLQEKRGLARAKSLANFGLYFGAGETNLDEIAAATGVPGTKLYLNTTTGNLKMDNEETWRAIFKLGKKVSLHAEGDTFARAVAIWQEEGYPCELHLCHASLRSELELVRELRNRDEVWSSASESPPGPPFNKGGRKCKISMEVCPHHLLMTGAERAIHGPFCCMKPELATDDDVAAMWEGIADGTIDMLATDHAPHTYAEKMEVPAPYGIPGVETLFQLMFTAFRERGLPLTQFVTMTSKNIVHTFDITDQKGHIEAGWDADVILVDPEWRGVIDPANFHSKCDWSPFKDRPVRGKVEKTFVNGNLIFSDGRFVDEESRGREVGFAH